MAEITVGDVLAWEPRLRLPPATTAGDVDKDLEREVSWAVSARATAPMLPVLHGGELIVLPRRIIAESGVSLPLLLREMAGHQVAAVILDGLPSGTTPLPSLVSASVGPEFEGEINRLLTVRRGELYRVGTELERLLTDQVAIAAPLPGVLGAAAGLLALPLVVVEANGATISVSADLAAPPRGTGQGGWRGDRLAVPLSGGRMLWVGPVPAPRRALARLVAPRLAAGVDQALARASHARPRGPARAVAVAALLTTTDGEERLVRASSLGLPVDGTYRVAMARAGTAEQDLVRAMAGMGTVHQGTPLDGTPVALVEVRRGAVPRDPRQPSPFLARHQAQYQAQYQDHARGQPGSQPPGRPASGTIQAGGDGRPEGGDPRGPGTEQVALSGPVAGIGGIAGSVREVRYVLALLGSGLIPGPRAAFDAIGDLGPYRLLYPLWGTPALTGFAADALGDLTVKDRRGALGTTLLTFLETGGSHVEAAMRLGIHRNTLAYRLKQIAALTGHDPSDPACRLLLHLGLLVHHLAASGHET